MSILNVHLVGRGPPSSGGEKNYSEKTARWQVSIGDSRLYNMCIALAKPKLVCVLSAFSVGTPNNKRGQNRGRGSSDWKGLCVCEESVHESLIALVTLVDQNAATSATATSITRKYTCENQRTYDLRHTSNPNWRRGWEERKNPAAFTQTFSTIVLQGIWWRESVKTRWNVVQGL